MTIANALAMVDSTCPNTRTLGAKLAWISQLAGQVLEFMRGFEGNLSCDGSTLPYREEDMNRELLVPFPYDAVYVHFICAMICYASGEFSKYENALVQHNYTMQQFRIQYARTHMPIQPRKRVL